MLAQPDTIREAIRAHRRAECPPTRATGYHLEEWLQEKDRIALRLINALNYALTKEEADGYLR